MIYFIQAKNSKAIKIGYTGNDPAARMASLQTGSPEPLELLASVPGGIEDERALHERFALHRLHGEWFNPDPSLHEHIDGLLGRTLEDVVRAERVEVWSVAGRALCVDGPDNDHIQPELLVFHRNTAGRIIPPLNIVLQAAYPRHDWYAIDHVINVTDKPACWDVPNDPRVRDTVRRIPEGFCWVYRGFLSAPEHDHYVNIGPGSRIEHVPA